MVQREKTITSDLMALHAKKQEIEDLIQEKTQEIKDVTDTLRGVKSSLGKDLKVVNWALNTTFNQIREHVESAGTANITYTLEDFDTSADSIDMEYLAGMMERAKKEEKKAKETGF